MRARYRGTRTLDSLVTFYSDVTGKAFCSYRCSSRYIILSVVSFFSAFACLHVDSDCFRGMRIGDKLQKKLILYA